MKDYFGYNGQVCVVTGAASGMGKATTEMLVDLGAEVYALDLMEVTTPGIKAFIKVSLGEKESIDEAFKQLPGQIDKFFGIAGVSGVRTDFNTTIAINFTANKYITDEYLTSRMKPGGAISYISSSGGLRWEKPDNLAEFQSVVDAKGWEGITAALNDLGKSELPGPLGYVLSKRALNYYIATIVPVFGQNHIRVNGVLPAATQSGLTNEFAAMKGGMDKFLESTGFAGRLAESREMAEPIVFLNSKMASYISGALLDVDFGLNILPVAGLTPDKSNFKLFSR
ncbi:SDR family oxidoreductase [Paenibacillus sp. YAF4_2]|uniref:SDR family oxidoreductase n=1 Tax=Paenibacillus sp. YAF4_2 TaxID=3233085 RepID=UPI003F9E1F50